MLPLSWLAGCSSCSHIGRSNSTIQGLSPSVCFGIQVMMWIGHLRIQFVHICNYLNTCSPGCPQGRRQGQLQFLRNCGLAGNNRFPRSFCTDIASESSDSRNLLFSMSISRAVIPSAENIKRGAGL